MLWSKLVCVLRTSLAAKSITSLVKLSWQLTEVSGRSRGRASIWAAEQVPAADGGSAKLQVRSSIISKERSFAKANAKIKGLIKNKKQKMELRLTAVQPTSAQVCRFYASESLIVFVARFLLEKAGGIKT